MNNALSASLYSSMPDFTAQKMPSTLAFAFSNAKQLRKV
jgi:hypothetical protein